jgi:hypothetical protein
MTAEEIKEEIELLFSSGGGEDGLVRSGLRQQRLIEKHRLNLSYLETLNWEGSSGHEHTRLRDSEAMETLTRNLDMPFRLMFSALHLLADSIIAYAGSTKREGEIRYYPAIALTFWSGFESFVRYASELLLVTVPSVPAPVALFLRESENVVDAQGGIRTGVRYRSVLDRYSVFLAHAYGLQIDRGSRYWQALLKAKDLRDAYTHVDVTARRAITTAEILEFIEGTLLGLIWPSSLLGRTLMLEQYFLYELWDGLRNLAEDFRERPLFLDWYLKRPSLFHCNFNGVDEDRFPSVRGEKYREAFSARVRDWREREGEDG